MASYRSSLWLATCAGALLVLGIGWLVPTQPAPSTTAQNDSDLWEVWTLLTRLEKECQPDAPSNDYSSTSSAPPTERNRREIIGRLHDLRETAYTEVKTRLEKVRDGEFGEMLIVLAAGLGDAGKVIHAAQIMAYSQYPAVRLCAARELRRLRDPRTAEWFDYVLINDERRVHNDHCSRSVEFYYPVRTVAELALKDMGRWH